MKVRIEYGEDRISLISGKSHFTLYSSDLENLWEDDAERFCDRVEDYLFDVMPDEGYGEWEWKSADLGKACHYVHKHLKK